MDPKASESGGDNEAVVVSMASDLLDKISSSVDNQNPVLLHALASVLESRFKEENDGFSHMIWHLIKVLWDEFYELISSTFLSESRYSESIRAGAARLLFIWSQSWKCTHCFDDRVLENIKRWAIDVTSRPSVSNHNSKHNQGGKKYRDIEMLRTYSTGLLAEWLTDGGQLVEDVLTSQLAGNLMRYLRLRVIADAPSNQKGVEVSIDNHVAERDLSIIRGFRDAKGEAVGTSPMDEELDEAMSSYSSLITFGGHAHAIKERSAVKNQFPRNSYDANKSSFRTGINDIPMERADNYDCFQECKIGFWNITDLAKKVVRASEAEARAANVPAETTKAAGDAAAELVRSAALEDYRKTNDENTLKSAELETSEDFEEFFILDSDSLAKLKDKLCIQCLVILGGNVEVLETVLHEKGVDVCISLLQLSSNLKDAPKVSLILPDVLMLINTLAVHPKFAALFVDCGGIPKLLAAPRVAETRSGLSYCLFTIGSVPGIMERVCSLSSNIVHQMVELALELLACPQNQARKNAALFFGAVFIFREILDAFDSCDGLKKMLSLLHDAASVRSGASFGSLPSSGFRNELFPPEVMTSSEKQLTYHTCVAMRQYFRAHLILLVDSVGPNKDIHTAAAYITNSRAAYKPLDISNEGVDAIFCQIRKDRKLGNALGRACFSVVDKFLSYNGHVTMLELCQAPLPVDRYVYGLQQYALDVLHIVTLVPYSRILIVNATVSNNRGGIAIILDAASCTGYVEPEIIQAALNVLVNLLCPLPSISNEPPVVTQGQPVSNIPLLENRDRNPKMYAAERVTILNAKNESRERNVEYPSSVDRSTSAATSSAPGIASQISASGSVMGSGLVGDRKITLGAGAGWVGLAAQLEHGYRQATEAVRANNGIKALLQILQSHIVILPGSLDCLRALACRVLLGLSRDNTIAHILTTLQVGKKLLELIRYSISQTPGTEQNRWQTELVQVAIELLGVVTNSSPTNALAATDAATPITYHSRELLQLIQEHLQASGMTESAAVLLTEAQLAHSPSMGAPSSLPHQANLLETCSMQIQWPSGRIPLGFMSDKINFEPCYEGSNLRCDSAGS